MRVGIFTDLHISKSGVMMRGGKSRLSYVEDSIEYFCNYCKNHKGGPINVAISCGDLTSSDNLTAEESKTLARVAYTLNETFTTTYHVLGNHERKDQLGYYTSIESLEIIPTQSIIRDMVHVGDNLVFIPYTEDESKVREFLDGVDDKGSKYVFSHLTLTEAGEFFNGMDVDMFKGFKLVVNGHIHNAGKPSQNIMNLGSLLGSNFGDDYKMHKPSFAILDTETGNLEIVENIYSPLYYKVNSIDKIPSDSRCYVKVSDKVDMESYDGDANVAITLTEENNEYTRVELDTRGVLKALSDFYDKMPKHQKVVNEFIK